jgi:hypothetical protein
MVPERGRHDDAQSFDWVEQQKGLAHILRSINDMVERKRGRAREFGVQLRATLQEALALWHRHWGSPVADFNVEAEALQAELTYHLRDRRLKDLDNQRLLNELGWHHDCGNVLRFLRGLRIESINKRAERTLRPTMIARKVSLCSENDRGAEAFAAFTSVIWTLVKAGAGSVVNTLSELFRPSPLQQIPT